MLTCRQRSRHSAFCLLSFILSVALFLPSVASFAQPTRSVAPAVRAPKPLSRLKVGDIIRARSSVTGKVEMRRVTRTVHRTVPVLLEVKFVNVQTGKPVRPMTCTTDQIFPLANGKRVPAARLAVGNAIVVRAGPTLKVVSLAQLRRPGGFVLDEVDTAPVFVRAAKTVARPAPAFALVPNLCSPSGSTFLFAGQQFDAETGLYYMRARYYDPEAGRFLSRDPYQGDPTNPITLNPYAYANDDPINFVDPSGQAGEGGLTGSLATIGTIAAVSAFYAGAILLNPAPANAPGPNDPIYADTSRLDTLYFIGGGEVGGRLLGAAGTRIFGPIARRLFARFFSGPSTRVATQAEGVIEDEVAQVVRNGRDGRLREQQVRQQLIEEHPDSAVLSERYLLDSNGVRLQDPITGKARRIDFAVVNGGRVERLVEVTSLTANKTLQQAKTERIRNLGETYIRVPRTRTLIPVAREIPEEILRLE